MVCEPLTCRTSCVGPPSRPAAWQSQLVVSLFSLDRFPGNGAPFTLNGRHARPLPACEMVLDIIGDLFTHGRQLKHFVFDGRIVSLLGELPILGRSSSLNGTNFTPFDQVQPTSWRLQKCRIARQNFTSKPGFC